MFRKTKTKIRFNLNKFLVIILLTPLNLLDLLNPSLMPPTFKFVLQKSRDSLFRFVTSQETGTQRKHISVIMHSCKLNHFISIPANSSGHISSSMRKNWSIEYNRTHSSHLICTNCLSLTGSSNYNP